MGLAHKAALGHELRSAQRPRCREVRRRRGSRTLRVPGDATRELVPLQLLAPAPVL